MLRYGKYPIPCEHPGGACVVPTTGAKGSVCPGTALSGPRPWRRLMSTRRKQRNRPSLERAGLSAIALERVKEQGELLFWWQFRGRFKYGLILYDKIQHNNKKIYHDATNRALNIQWAQTYSWITGMLVMWWEWVCTAEPLKVQGLCHVWICGGKGVTAGILQNSGC